MTMSSKSRREYLTAMRSRYQAANSRRQKTTLLDEIVQVLGYHRKYVIAVISRPASPSRSTHRRRRTKKYHEALYTIERVWQALDYPCAERLHPVLLETAQLLAQHRELTLTPAIALQLDQISCATLARRLAAWRTQKPPHRVPRPRPRTRLQSDVPIARYAWNEDRPGALEIDLVEHNGGQSSGHFAYTLTVVDVVSGWSCRRAILGKGQAGVFHALICILAAWPFEPWCLHSDNGSEFLNDHLTRFCRDQGLQFHRSRPYRKNDQPHVEQKNRQYVRDIVGHDRFDSHEHVHWLNRVYAVLDPYANLFLPMRKVVSKQRIDGRLIKHYDKARTPYQRLCDLAALTDDRQHQLQRIRIAANPLDLHRQLQQILDRPPVHQEVSAIAAD